MFRGKPGDELGATSSTNGHVVSQSSPRVGSFSDSGKQNTEDNGKPFDGIPSHSHHRAASSGCIASTDGYDLAFVSWT